MATVVTLPVPNTNADRYGFNQLQVDEETLNFGTLNTRVLTAHSEPNIPPAALILSATVTYYQTHAHTAEPRHLRVHALFRAGINLGNSDVAGAATTSYGTGGPYPAGTNIPLTVDVTAPIQELVDEPGWNIGRTGVILRAQRDPDLMDHDGDWQVWDYSHDPNLAAVLTIEWQPQGPPTAAFTYQTLGDGQVSFEDLSAPNRHPITGWSWSFGEGNTSTEQHPDHTFTSSGDHDVTLTVTAADDLTDTVTTAVHVPPWQLEAAITGGITGRTVTMAAVVITPDPPVTSTRWAMGDGTELTGPDITHTYTTPGAYTITLTVTDAANNQVIVTRDVRTQEVTDWSDTDPAVIEQLMAAHVRATTATVDIITPDHDTAATLGGPDATHPGVVTGTVTIDGDRHVRHTANLTITDANLVPDQPGDLLHPLSHNQVRIWWMVQAPDGTWIRDALATGYVTKPATTDDGLVRLAVEIEDVAARVAAARWDTTPDTEGHTISGAANIVWADRAPGAPTRITHTDQAPPEDWEIGAPGDDPNDDLDRLADAAGCVWYADARGHLVFEPAPTPGAILLSWVEGPGCQVTELGRELSLEDTANVVQVISTSNEVDPPIEVTVSNTDEDSPLSVDRGWRLVAPVVESGEITTTEQARELAEEKLAQYTALTELVEVVHRADPRVRPGIGVHLEREASKVSATYQVLSTSISLGESSRQRTVMAPRKVKL